MSIRHATEGDLPAIVAIYNAAIPGRMATADTEPVTVQQREEWFRGFSPQSRPLWIFEANGAPAGWLGLRSFYGRPGYYRTVESGVYVSPNHRRAGIARQLLRHALAECPRLGIANVMGFIFAHNEPSIALYEAHGFARWGLLPRICELDGSEKDVLILGRRL
jgi:phosphinothricin acetyltransferase